jgi:hypothetical protein
VGPRGGPQDPISLLPLDEREAFVRQTLVTTGIIGAAGAATLFFLGRGAWAIAFGVGAAVSLANFLLIARAVKGMGGAGAPEARGRLWKGSLFRFAIVGLVLAAALLVFRESLLALVAGLLIAQLGMIALWLMRALRASP